MDHDSPTGSHRIALMQGMQPPPEYSGQVPAWPVRASSNGLLLVNCTLRTMITVCFWVSTIESSAVRLVG
jgi:hypothetical protein